MKKSRQTKRALIPSILAVIMCVAMLIGTTFAWFTDTASTSVNKIEAGKLDVALEMKNPDYNVEGKETKNQEWISAEGQPLEFKKAAGAAENEAVLWEPGCTYTLPELRVVNKGNLALKYKVIITGIQGDVKLNEAIEWTISDTALDSDHSLAANATSETLTIKGHMKEDAGNEYQDLSIDGISITVYATQDTVEYDSYGDQYDAAAEYATPVTTADELVTAITDGEDVVLKNDVTLPENTTLAITKSVTIYGDGTTSLKWNGSEGNGRVINIDGDPDTSAGQAEKDRLSDLTLTLSGVDIVGPTDNSENRGISVWGVKNFTLIMDNCTASANHYALNIAKNNTNAKVIIRNTTLTGYTAFQTWSEGTNATFENCTLIGNNLWTNVSGSTSNNCATIKIVNDSGNDNAKNSTLTFKNCRIEANEKGQATKGSSAANQNLLSADASGATVTFDGCRFFVNDTEVTGDAITKKMSLKDDTTLTIK